MSTTAPLAQSTAFSLSELRAVEKQQLRLLLEQQQSAQPSASSPLQSYATPYPIMSLSDDWYQATTSTSPLPPPMSSQDDDFSSFLATDDPSSLKLSSFTSSFPSSPPYPTPSPPPFLPFSSFSSSSITKRSAPLPDSLEQPSKRHAADAKKLSSSSSFHAHYPLLSREVVDGFFSGAVGMGAGVMGGLDDAELGLALSSPKNQQVTVKEEEGASPQPTLPLPPHQRLSSITSLSSNHSLPSLSLPPILTAPLPPFALSSVLSHLTSSASSVTDAASLSTPRFDEPDHRGEGVRRAKRRLTDKQRRAKIKDGLEQLRSLVASHGNVSSDQASIVQSSVELVEQLVEEREGLRTALRRVREERLEMEREQQAQLLQKQRLQAQQQPQQANQQADGNAPNLSVLLQHLQSLVSTGTAGAAVAGAEQDSPAAAGGLDSVILSKYFLQTLQLLSQLPRQPTTL